MAGKSEIRKLVVIGAGPGGYAAAFLASDLGINVTLIDLEENPGGVCLYRGCIPTKALLHLAKLIQESRDAKEWGIEFGEPRINIDKVRAWKNSVVGKLTGGLGQLCKRRKIEYIQGLATFADSNALNVKREDGGTEKIQFENAIIATGSSPAVIPGIDADSNLVMDSTKALELKKIPSSLLIIGGGYIGLEMGSIYASLGTRVSVVEMTQGLMPGSDPELIRILSKSLETLFESVMLKTKVSSVKQKDGALQVSFEGDNAPSGDMEYEKILVSVGRKPNTANIGLENTKVRVDERGFIITDLSKRTDDPSIYAIGDVAGGLLLAHKASHEGIVAAKNIAGKNVIFDPAAIPFVEYTDPEIAECGLSEERAKKEGRDVRIARFPWAASGRALAMGRSDGLTKLVIDTATERVLGVGIAGPNAGELISEGVFAVEMGALASDIALTIHPHPTLSETIMEAAEVFYGHSTHVYKPRRD